MRFLPLPPNSKDSSLSPEINAHHNALRQISVDGGSFGLSGFSISGLASYIQVPELDICFDMGECPLSAVSLDHVFLTHAHGDHSRCLMRHDSLRKMIGIEKPAFYYVPESIYPVACDWIRAEAIFEGVSPARFALPSIIPVANNIWLPLEYRPDLLFRAFPVRHSLPSIGFTVALHKRKLKDEFLGLHSQDLIRLKAEGTEITREVIEPKITYIGDCIGESLLDQSHIWESDTVVLECTFLDSDEVPMARKKGHTHLFELVHALEVMGDLVKCKRIVLKHFSMKYGRKHILNSIQRAMPERFRDRVIALI
jgi:ribonuclease Z